RPIPDKELAEALRPTIEAAIYASVRNDVNIIATAIFPAIGSGIRKAVVTAIREMTQTLNQTLEYGFSNQSLKWRLEALSTGKSFAEIVLLHSLLYRVEQVFLIHKETGLLLQHVVAPEVAAQDAELVSAMLTAIRDFVQDSFSVQNGDTLDTLQYGELTLWVEQGPQAILAGVIRGNAPQKLRANFQDALERIHLEQSSALESFDGDVLPFVATKPELEACLQAQYERKKQKPSPLLWIALGAIGIGVLTWGGLAIRDYLRWVSYLEKLNNEPGITVTKIQKQGNKYFIFGLRDPLAIDPKQALKAAQVNPNSVIMEWKPYLSLEPALLAARARQLLRAPDSVSLKADENGVLYARGSAPHQWIAQARQQVQLIPGITQFRTNLTDTNLGKLQSLQKQVEKQIIRFVKGTPQLQPNQDDTLEKLAQDLEKLFDTAQSSNKGVQVKIVGHTDEIGWLWTNMQLSQGRADAILSTLVSKGVNPTNLKAVGVGSTQPLKNESGVQEPEINRSVSFEITITDRPNSRILQR
ncbi:MAG TPA: OmpA family protein, partial [Coleofasciculaceae cyanobacterium]